MIDERRVLFEVVYHSTVTTPSRLIHCFGVCDGVCKVKVAEEK